VSYRVAMADTGAATPPPPRVAIERVTPTVDGGRFAAKALVDVPVVVEADVFADGHDLVAAAVQIRPVGVSTWVEVPMRRHDQDRFRAEVTFRTCGVHEMVVVGWIDRFASWLHGARRKAAAGSFLPIDRAVGAIQAREAARRADGHRTATELTRWADALQSGAFEPAHEPTPDAADLDAADADAADLEAADAEPEIADERIVGLVHRFADREPLAMTASRRFDVARPLAGCSAWYELFPRSWGEGGAHGTLADVERALPYVADMGFDVVYLPPIHPIGVRHRKGPDNRTTAEPGDLGSPWAIGAAEGGHTAVHPALGTLDDLRHLVGATKAAGMELALDLAFQCSPDHPWVEQCPQWFRHRPDGSIQSAENPPKRYEDIYPIDFESADWQNLWLALEGVVRHWIEHGVRIFRVDNPHTKPFAFWEWLIARTRADHPEVIFLAEAFTRPTVMHRLAKVGFDQSYTYFTWRQTPWELREYLTELTQTEVADFFRPNAWPNTPDILTEQLQFGGRPTFVTRLVLAATLFANYGIYGPTFELQEHVARAGAEEYAGNEKYELRRWDLDAEHSLRPLIRAVNRIRREHAALRTNTTLRFHDTDNPALLVYSKSAPALTDADGAARSSDHILVVVNTDPHHRQSGFVSLDLAALGVEADESFAVIDLLDGSRYQWSGPRNYVELDPAVLPAHIFSVNPRARTEHDFDYF
jgi:starch synthase (maltosyl-transferring)